MLIRPIYVDSRRLNLVLGKNLDDVDDSTRILGATLSAVSPLLALLLGILAWWLTGRTLRPVEAMRREVMSIHGGQLHRRVPVPDADDEIAELARTMNDMLGRLESAEAQQQQFVDDASHEMRTPLTRMVTDLEVAIAYPSRESAEDTYSRLLPDARDIQMLIHDLLYLARTSSDRVAAQEEVDLDDIALVVAHRSRVVARAHLCVWVGQPCHLNLLSGWFTVLSANEDDIGVMSSALALKPLEQAASNLVDQGPQAAHDHRERLRVLLTPQARLARWGTSSVSPFTIGDDRVVHELSSGGFVGVQRWRRWAVMASDPIAPPGKADETLDDALARLADHRIRPLFAAAADDAPYRARGLWTTPIADDALIDLASFTLVGKRMASIRHSVSAGKRAGLTIVPWSPAFVLDAAEVSGQWLATKRGGELGFTLGRFDPTAMAGLDCRVALDASGRVAGLVTWHAYNNGRARVLDLMRRAPGAPNPTMDLLIADSLLSFAARGTEVASLGCVPRSHGRAAERIYPTASLRRYKDKFAPHWEPRHLVAPSCHHAPGALIAVARAYCPSGLMAATRPNR